MSARIGVVTFPGSLDDRDAARAIRLGGGEPVSLWHDEAALRSVDAVILPGGFSYGDYLRCGAIARFSEVMGLIADASRAGMPVLGVCNGFQVLCESHLLPGALVRNAHLRYRNAPARMRVETDRTAWTAAFGAGAEVVFPAKHGEGRYVADEATLDELEDSGRIVFRYLDNPNGAMRDIAGVTNEAGNVVGLMPHPEHAVEALTGPSTDGLGVIASVLRNMSEGAAR